MNTHITSRLAKLEQRQPVAPRAPSLTADLFAAFVECLKDAVAKLNTDPVGARLTRDELLGLCAEGSN